MATAAGLPGGARSAGGEWTEKYNGSIDFEQAGGVVGAARGHHDRCRLHSTIDSGHRKSTPLRSTKSMPTSSSTVAPCLMTVAANPKPWRPNRREDTARPGHHVEVVR